MLSVLLNWEGRIRIIWNRVFALIQRHVV